MALIKWKNIYLALKCDAFQITESSPFRIVDTCSRSTIYHASDHISCEIQWMEKRIFNAKNLSRAEMHRRLLYILLVISWAYQLTNNLGETRKKGQNNNAYEYCKLILIEKMQSVRTPPTIPTGWKPDQRGGKQKTLNSSTNDHHIWCS